MLSRAALPLLRPRTVQAASRLALLPCQTRGIRDRRERLNDQPDYEPPSRSQQHSSHREPLRPVPKSDAEWIISHQQQPAREPEPDPEPEPEPISASSRRPQPLPDLRNGIPSEFDTDTQPQQPQQPLPDLTRGIPSTIEAELDQASRRHASKDSLNITEDPGNPQGPIAGGGRSDDGLPREAYISSSDRKRNRLIQVFYATFGLGSIGYLLYMGRNWANEEEQQAHPDVLNGYTPGLMYARAMARFGSTMSYYKDPVVPKLLPDPDVYPEGQGPPPFTLVLSLEDMLVHSEWSREHGWRVAKRPGLDYFLKYLSQYYELVMFTSQPAFAIEQMLRKMDPYQLMYPLFREHTAYEDGVHVKDLSYLNRKLDKVLIIDTDAKHVMKQPENAIILPKWTGDPNDKTLVEFIPFLEYLANMGFQDTREVLKSFEDKYIPAEFDRRQKLLRDKFQAQQAEKKRPKHSLGGLSSFFGTKPQPADGQLSISQAEAEGKMIWDQIRERGQQNYLALEKRIQEEGEKWLAEQKAAEAKMQEEAMNNFKSGMFGWFGGSKKPETNN